jgi:hypothetical protein
VFYLNGGSQQQAQYGAYDLQCFVNYAADGVRWDNSPLPGIDPGGGPIVVGSVVTPLGNPDGIILLHLHQRWRARLAHRARYGSSIVARSRSNPDVPLVNWLAHGLLPATAPVAQVATGGSIIADDQIRWRSAMRTKLIYGSCAVGSMA